MAKALFLEEGCGLVEQGLQNLKTMTNGELSYNKVKDALIRLDVSKEKLTSSGVSGSRAFLADDSTKAGDHSSELDEDDDIDTEAETAVLAEIEELDLSEDEGSRVLMALKDNRKKIWSENKALKAKIKTY